MSERHCVHVVTVLLEGVSKSENDDVIPLLSSIRESVHNSACRVLSTLGGGKMLKVIVDGGCTHRPQFSGGGGSGGMPPPPRIFLNSEPSESGSEAF